MSRSIQVGDFVIVSLGDQQSKFVIQEISIPYIYIHPENDPSQKSGLISTSQGWKIQGAEHIPYQLSFKIGRASCRERV